MWSAVISDLLRSFFRLERVRARGGDAPWGGDWDSGCIGTLAHGQECPCHWGLSARFQRRLAIFVSFSGSKAAAETRSARRADHGQQ